MKFKGKVALSMLCSIGLSIGVSAQLYWVGGNNSWQDPSAWSYTPQGSSCSCTPNESTDVVFTTPANVVLDNNAACRSFIVQGSNNVNLSGSAQLHVHGNLQAGTETVFSLSGLRFEGSVVHAMNYPAAMNSPVTLGNGLLELQSNALFMEGLTIEHGAFNAEGRGIVTTTFHATDSHSQLIWNGTKMVVEDEAYIHPSISVEAFEETIWPGVNLSPENINAGNAQVAWSRAATCGTGPGQTPFTITASVASDYNGQDISCNGAEDGQATVSVVGGVGPFSYIWIGGNAPGNQQNYNNLGAGTYTVLVNDLGQGITCVDNVQLSEPPQLTVFSFSYTPPTCEDLCNGTGTPIVIGGVFPYDFLWSSGETTQTATQLCNGPNTLEFVDLNGCAFDTTFNIIPNSLLINLTTTDAGCFGEASGSANANPSGGQGAPYTITWSDNSIGNDFLNLVAGTYTVQVEDAAGCLEEETFIIGESQELIVDLDLAVDPSCPGAGDGSIEVTVSGGTAPYTTNWSALPGYASTDEDIFNLTAGSYDLQVTDDNGCIAALNVPITDPDAIAITANITDVTCNGGTNGSIDVTISGGAGFYVVLWSGPNGYTSPNTDINGLAAGDYTIQVTDANLCVEETTFTVAEPTAVTVNPLVTPTTCNGANDAEIVLDIAGGVGPYTATWTGPNGYNATGLSHGSLAPGIYDITVFDNNNCPAPIQVEITEPTELVLETVVTPMSCNGADDAAIDLTISGGGNNYIITWTGPSVVDGTQEDQANLAAGVYNLEVTDDLNCTELATVNIIEPDVITATAAVTDVSCGGFTDGEIELTIAGGTGPFTTTWSGPNGFASADEDLLNLGAGDYTVDIVDDNGCIAQETYTIIETLPLDITLASTPITCNGDDDATIDLTIAGGLAPIVIEWTGPNGFVSADEDINNLEPGIYAVLVTDANACFREDQLEITEPDAIDITVATTEPGCNGDATGSIELTITGGVAPFTVNWDNGSNGETITNLVAGVYTATISDNSGCEPTLAPITIAEPDELELVINTVQPDCATAALGSITTTVTGGTAPYDFLWTGPNAFLGTDPDIANPADGLYEVTVTDAEGCATNGTTEIITPTALDVLTAPSTPLCEDDLVSIDVTILNGTAPFVQEWTLPGGATSANEDIVDGDQGTYQLLITDLNGCIYEETFDLTAADPLTATGLSTPLDCTGDPVATINLDITGGLPPYSVVWTSLLGFASTDEDLTDLAADTYEATITDAQNCVVVLQFVIDPVDVLNIDGVVTDVTCQGFNNGAIDVTLTGGIAPYLVTWTSLLGFASTDEDITGLAADMYTIVATDATGCENTAVIEVQQPDELVSNAIIAPVLCADDLASVDVTVSGGTAPYVITWTFPDASVVVSEDIANVPQGTYVAAIEDAAGCSAQETFDLVAQNPLDLTATTTPLDCTGDPIATNTTTLNSGEEPVNYVWTGPNGFASVDANLTGLEAGTYDLVATDNQGCVVNLSVEIEPVDLLEITGVASTLLCNGDSDGTINITVTGGVPPLAFEWESAVGFFDDQEDVANLMAGTYTVVVSDANDCQVDAVFEITEPTAINVSNVVSDVFCPADLVSVDLTISGGTAPYNVEWTLPSGATDTNEDLVDVEQGQYELLVTDDNGCEYTETFDLVAVDVLTVDGQATPLDCTGEPIATIDLTISGGVAPYDIAWTSILGFTSSDEDLANLVADTYFVTVTDQQGCEENLEFVIDPVDILEVAGTASTLLCNGDNNGSIDITITGGVAPYQIDWNDGNGVFSNQEDLTDLVAGVYEVAVTDANDCSVTESFEITEPALLEVTSITTDVLCPADLVSIDITITGGTPPYDVEWTLPSGGTDANEDLVDVEQGSYTLTVTDDNGCLYNQTFDLVADNVLTADGQATPLDCTGDPIATIDITVSGGVAPYNIDWTSPLGFASTDEDLFNLSADTYTATITDQQGCVEELEFVIDPVDVLTIDGLATNPACNGEQTGSIVLDVNGGIAPYTFTWTSIGGFASTDQDIFNLGPDVYTIVVTDAENCSNNEVITLTEPDVIVVQSVASDVVCPDDLISIDITVTGGVPPYDVVWTDENMNVINSEDLTDVAQGSYELTLTDQVGCVYIETFDLTAPDGLEADGVITPLDCTGNAIAAIDLTVMGGVAPYAIAWSGPNGFASSDEDINDLEAGDYTVVITDQGGCVLSIEFTIDLVEELVIPGIVTDVLCNDGVTGSIDISPTGGIQPYTFDWSGPFGFDSANEDAANLVAGTYELTVTDATGCSQEASFLVGEPAAVQIDVVLSAVVCPDDPIDVDATISGGTPGYDIVWTDPNGNTYNTEDLIGVPQGEYTAVVTDAANCEAQLTVGVTPPNVLQLTASVTPLDCSGNPVGAIDLVIQGGTGPYTVAWTSINGFNSADEDIFNLAADTYTVVVTDQTGCVESIDVEIEPVLPLDATPTATSPVCGGQNTGSISLQVQGGEAPYTFLWTGQNAFNSTDQDIDNLAAGSYEVTITDASGCFIVVPVEVDDLSPMTLSATVTDVTCSGDASGSIDLTVTGGTAPYTFEWTAQGFAASDEDINNLSADLYEVLVTDAGGCEAMEVFTVSELIGLAAQFDVVNSTCGNTSGSISVVVTGGTDPIDIQWFDDQLILLGTGDVISDLGAGQYTIVASDANGCSLEENVNVSDSDAVQVTLETTDLTCDGAANGAIEVTTNGGTGVLTFTWTGPNGFISADEDINALEAGNYEVEVTDEVGCVAFASAELGVVDNTLTADGQATNLACGSLDSGAIDLNIQGGLEPYTVAWVGPNGFTSSDTDLANLAEGAYTATIEDAHGCVVVLDFVLDSSEAIDVQVDVTPALCVGDANGSISTSVISGQAPFAFEWTGPNGFTSTNSDLALLEAGDYELIVTDAEGCSLEATIAVEDGNAIEILTATTEPDCLANNGVLEALASGGNGGPYDYFWYDADNGNALVANQAEATNLFAGNYMVEVFDATGCSASLEIALSNNNGDLDASITNALCFNDANGAIDLTVNGLTGPFAIEWSNDNGFASVDEDISDLTAGVYTVEVVDALGCFVSDEFEVTQPTEIGVEFNITNLLCFGVDQGAIETTVSGDEVDYQFAWTGPDGFTSDQQNISDLAAGCYDLVVTGLNNCSVTAQACVLTPDTLDLVSIPTGVVCNGGDSGSIEIEISGGTGLTTTLWVGPNGFSSSDEDIFNLIAGQYDLQVEDENGCVIQTSILVDENMAITAVADTTLPACPGDTNGGFTLTISGGVAPYSVSWMTGAIEVGTGETLTNVGAGTYDAVITDAAGCSVTLPFELTDPDPIEVVDIVIGIQCNGDNNGSIELLINGGVAPYTTTWTGPNGFTASDEDIFLLEPGTYELVLTDASGCSQTIQYQIDEPEALDVSIAAITDATCLTSEDGSVTIAISGGSPDYTVEWTDANGTTINTQNLENVAAGTYDLVVTDANGCSFAAPGIQVSFTGDAQADAGADVNSCDGAEVEIIGQNTGATATWWQDEQGNEVAVTDTLSVQLPIGTYTYTYFVQDGDCIVSDEVTITVNPLPEVEAGDDQEVFADETATLGGNPTTDGDNLVVWTPGDLLQDDTELNPTTIELSTSTYFYVEATDINGCTATDSVFVLIIPSVDVPSGFTPNGDGMNDTWLIANSAFYPNIQVAIFTRWGEEVFNSNGYNEPWEGLYNGEPLPIGTYYYVIEINEPRFPNPLTGPVTIIR